MITLSQIGLAAYIYASPNIMQLNIHLTQKSKSLRYILGKGTSPLNENEMEQGSSSGEHKDNGDERQRTMRKACPVDWERNQGRSVHTDGCIEQKACSTNVHPHVELGNLSGPHTSDANAFQFQGLEKEENE